MATHQPVIIDELFGELASTGNSVLWQVIHTKPQCEKKLAGYLKTIGIHYYLPLLDSVRHYKYRKVIFTKPMFPGYIFSGFEQSRKTEVLVSGYVVKFLKVKDDSELLEELRQIKSGRDSRADIQQGVWLENGWQVEITGGPMQGMRGIVQSQSRLDEVNLQVNILRRAVTLKVRSSDVRILGIFNSHNEPGTGQ